MSNGVTLRRLPLWRTRGRQNRHCTSQGKEQKLIHVPAIEPREHKEGRYVTIEELEKDDADFDRAYAAADSALQAALRRVNELRSLAKKDEKGKWQSIAKMIETARLALVA
jgi:hypothetical protein